MSSLRIVLFTMLFLVPFTQQGQSNTDVIKNIQTLMIENYIFLDKAEETNLHLDGLMKEHYFDQFSDPSEFAKALSTEMQRITNDKHLNVAPPRPPRAPRDDAGFTSTHLANLERFRTGGFGKMDLLTGNVGYVELKGFRREDISKVDVVMDYFSTADAIIIDLRENGGGSELGLYWSSYFLEENLLLSGKYERRTDATVEFRTVHVKGVKRPEMPLFILTSNHTFSAAEAFAYDLQSRARATIIGESTGGGAHPVDFMRLPKGYALIVPYAESTNPITNSNWEGVGVIPDVKTSSEASLAEAMELASFAAKNYREKPFNELDAILKKEDISQADEDAVLDLFELLLSRSHLEDFMINDMGYSYLENKQLNASCAIFKANAILFNDAPNAHDSYAEALALKGEKDEALKQYELAVLHAKKNNDPQLEMYEQNLKDFKGK